MRFHGDSRIRGKKNMAEKLLRLEAKHPKTYEFLNALVDIFVKGLPYLYYCHVDRVLERKSKIERRKDSAAQRQYERDVQDLEYAKKEYERQKQGAEYYYESAESGFESARKGDGIFTTAKEKRKQAGKDLDIADWHSQLAEEERQRIEKLERRLGK